MTVKELIEKLKEFDQDLYVMYEDSERGSTDIRFVSLKEEHWVNKEPYISIE